jgi:hypothetical protein
MLNVKQEPSASISGLSTSEHIILKNTHTWEHGASPASSNPVLSSRQKTQKLSGIICNKHTYLVGQFDAIMMIALCSHYVLGDL